MPTLAKIVLPVDFSERSHGAARYARALALHFESEVILAHALALLVSDLGAMEITGSVLADLYRTRAGEGQRQLDEFAKAELSGVRTRSLVLQGDPASEIVRLAHDEDASLIAMPTHGYGPFRRFILGSVAAKVLHDSDCPVWTGVHMEAASAEAAIPFRRILCALDLASQSAKTLGWAAWLSREFQASLTLIHAITAHPGALIEGVGPWPEDMREIAEEDLLTLQRDAGVEWADALLEAGEAARVICSAAARLRADILVIGRSSASGAFGRLRATAYSIIRQSPCPVVSV